ncbi:MAG: hypothetical protein R8P61_03705 [Bacteroidia bacterium]|nr:hypothetical protein [Bacteroidia bacterium]
MLRYYYFFLLIGLFSFSQAQTLPEGYKLLYSEDFEHTDNTAAFSMTDANAWRLHETRKNNSLELFQQSKYKTRVRSPFNIALIDDLIVGDFILEAELVQTGKEYGHRDMCVFFGVKDPSNFYYVHFASKTDDNAHNIFIVNDEPRTKISSKTSPGINWGETNEPHKIRIERTLADGMIKVYFDDMSAPIMEAEDRHFDFGKIGFGSFDDTGRVDNIKVWGKETKSSFKSFVDR